MFGASGVDADPVITKPGDIIGAKLVSWTMFGFSFTTTVGMLPFPITFLLTDVINEFYGKRAARFITLLGFGMGVLRKTVADLLRKHPHVATFYPAPPSEGGAGATVAELK